MQPGRGHAEGTDPEVTTNNKRQENVMPANRTPVVFIHGMWLHASSWAPWLELFRTAGYDPIAPGWPGEPGTVTEARESPELVANASIDDATAHYTKIIDSLDAPPILIGHSFGGLFAEKLLGQGIGVAGVAIDPAQIKGVLPLPLAQLRAALPALGNPANLHRSVSLTLKEFRFGFGNALSEEESAELFGKWAIPSPARPLFEAATANFSLHSQAEVDTGNETRGPLLLISGAEDHTVPDVSTRSTLKQYRHSTAVTELKQFEHRGHSLTVDSGWKEVADATLQWLSVQGL
jgi:pimeloyl-ACP methyl ester carboxylesterase